MLKENILSILTMEDVLNKYGIKSNKNMCCCPFHKDKTASMKVYKDGFYCFGCNRGGDLIKFVQLLFNLNFYEAMEKLNMDFNLNLQTRGIVNQKELNKIQKEYEIKREKEKIEKEKLNLKLNRACRRYRIYNTILIKLKNKITPTNWEDIVEVTSYLEMQLELLENYINVLQFGATSAN